MFFPWMSLLPLSKYHCGGFKICPQILGHASQQEQQSNSSLLNYGSALVTSCNVQHDFQDQGRKGNTASSWLSLRCLPLEHGHYAVWEPSSHIERSRVDVLATAQMKSQLATSMNHHHTCEETFRWVQSPAFQVPRWYLAERKWAVPTQPFLNCVSMSKSH